MRIDDGRDKLILLEIGWYEFDDRDAVLFYFKQVGLVLIVGRRFILSFIGENEVFAIMMAEVVGCVLLFILEGFLRKTNLSRR